MRKTSAIYIYDVNGTLYFEKGEAFGDEYRKAKAEAIALNVPLKRTVVKSSVSTEYYSNGVFVPTRD